MTSIVKVLFSLGQVVATPGALSALGDEGIRGEVLLNRHVSGDWGEMTQGDKDENDLSVREGFRVLSAYDLPRTGKRMWVITESDRSATTLLLPDEY